MRTEQIIHQAWFSFGDEPEMTIQLPHTWNALDGQDGGNDYRRGCGRYRLALPRVTNGKRQFVRFEGANHVAEVRCNGRLLGTHKGGFSTFCFELTDAVTSGENVLEVAVDNDSPQVYPQQADFTFFGGLYRPVTFFETDTSLISPLQNGTSGVRVTADAGGQTCVEVLVERPEGCEVQVRLLDAGGQAVAVQSAAAQAVVRLEFAVNGPHLWDGVDDPYLYTAEVALRKGTEAVDWVAVRYGYRSFRVDAEQGFFLNGRSYPLHGVSRHQDRKNKGWAISEADHREDMQIICDMGANSVRLAHYQHSQFFYDLCDEKGLVVWAEIPVISKFIPGDEARENALQQMRELVLQNSSHPSICFWGISNEITMCGESEALLENQKELHALAKQLDPTRLTTIAHVHSIDGDNPYSQLTDVHGFNAYLGWYTGETADNGPLLDTRHAQMPNRPMTMSEYGADALTTLHSATPQNHDYTEEYQAQYHEQML